MTKEKFSAMALDDLIRQCTQSSDQISKQLASYGDQSIAPACDPSIRDLVNQSNGQDVDYKRVYAQLQKLIQNGNNAMELINSLDPSSVGSDTIAATTSLMNAVKSCISQFTKIHLMHIKHKLNMQMQQVRQAHREKMLQMKLDAKSKARGSQFDGQIMTVFDDKTTNQIYQLLQQRRSKE